VTVVALSPLQIGLWIGLACFGIFLYFDIWMFNRMLRAYGPLSWKYPKAGDWIFAPGSGFVIWWLTRKDRKNTP
jgi:hypothetical protein